MLLLDIIGTMLVCMAIAVVVTAITAASPVRIGWKLAFAAGAGLWSASIVLLAIAGAFAHPLARLETFLFPLVVSVLLVAGVPAVRKALLAIPMPVLIGVNSIRTFGWLFLALAAVDRLSGPFPLSAGWGDIITGTFAIPAAYLSARKLLGQRSLLAISAWNTFGFVDLIVALIFGLISTSGSPFQLLHVGMGASAMGTLPWVFVPAFLVPVYLIAHGLVFAQLSARFSSDTSAGSRVHSKHGNAVWHGGVR
ncbi:MAG: hypothetical protein JWP44_4279 [Mucilaginibacter sp.]|nr:hypothetical protein [Mucilaginibacter sp.]